AAMLFRPPELKSLPIDRIAFIALILVLAIRFLIRRERLKTYPATWPLLALLVLGLWGAITQPYDSQTWSVLVAKWLVPFSFFHIAGWVFNNHSSLRKLETFLLVVLLYLAAISVLSLATANSFIFPSFITYQS